MYTTTDQPSQDHSEADAAPGSHAPSSLLAPPWSPSLTVSLYTSVRRLTTSGQLKIGNALYSQTAEIPPISEVTNGFYVKNGF